MIALDTNILIYADTSADPNDRHAKAVKIFSRLMEPEVIACIPLQVLGEFINVCRHKNILSLQLAANRLVNYAKVFQTPHTLLEDQIAASILSAGHKLQFFDALIITVAARAGAKLLLSEDMQDGLEVEGLRVVNPFVAGNAKWIDSVIDRAR